MIAAILAYVYKIFGLTGANTDAAGTTTLFARLRQIYEYLTTNLSTTRAGYIDRLNAGGIPGTVKSIQRGNVYVSGVTYTRVTISPVNLPRSVVTVYGGARMEAASTGSWAGMPMSVSVEPYLVPSGANPVLSDTLELTPILTGVTSTVRIVCQWQVIEYY